MGFAKTIGIVMLLFLISNEIQEETILWEKNKKLSWSDFKGTAQNNRAAAITASGLTYRFSTTKENNRVVDVDFEVFSYFYPNKSWYIPELCDTVILSHEQLHFDITEVYAQKFRNRLGKATFTNNVKAEVKAIYNQINLELNDYQDVYDLETDYSRDREMQMVWNARIDSVLRD
ncbi:MAG: DUF922 domain-containing protein [Cellulophaga sp.]|nr:DUF922 domain-containing protein [Cellulophaga sp.]